VCALFREHRMVLHNTNLSKVEHMYKVRVSEQPYARGTHTTVMMMMMMMFIIITAIIILLKVNKEELSKIVNTKINSMAQYRCHV